MNANYRLPYKVAKSGKYWPGASVAQRVSNLLGQFQGVLTALTAAIGGITLPLPAANTVRTLSSLKCFEDAIDALVSAWVGIKYLQNQAVALGDPSAAIWNAT